MAEAGWHAGAGDVVCFYVDDHIRRLHALDRDRMPDRWMGEKSVRRARHEAALVGDRGGHWLSAASRTSWGQEHVLNLLTEEVYTTPD